MNIHRCVVFLILPVIIALAGSSVYAQNGHTSTATSSTVNENRIQEWIKNELAAHPDKARLAAVADSYERMLYVEAARALGIDLAASPVNPDEIESPAQPADSGQGRNI